MDLVPVDGTLPMTGETREPEVRTPQRDDGRENHELERSELERVVGGEKARPGVGPSTPTSTNL